jgi:hypothetical protein
MSCAAEQPALYRLAEYGPPAEYAGPAEHAGGWRAALLAELPCLQPAPSVPVLVPRKERPRPARALITEAEARGLAGAMARAVLETLEGRRPVQQLTTMLNGRAVAAVQTLCRGGLRWPVRGAAVGSVRVFLPRRDAVEACVTFRCDQRTRVLALRIDRQRRRWVGTAVRIG